MSTARETIEELDGLMREYGLTEATLRQGLTEVTFRKSRSVSVVAAAPSSEISVVPVEEEPVFEEPVAVAPKGTPISSPMNGIFYNAPSPGSPPFVKEGDTIQAGQPIGLIEAMKVFNEIPSPISGVVLSLVAKPGAVVAPGETLLLVG